MRDHVEHHQEANEDRRGVRRAHQKAAHEHLERGVPVSDFLALQTTEPRLLPCFRGVHELAELFRSGPQRLAIGALLMGYLVRIKRTRTAPLQWLSYLVFHRWAYSGFTWAELRNRRFFYPMGCERWPGASGVAPFNSTSRPSDLADLERVRVDWWEEPSVNPLNLPKKYLKPYQLEPKC